MELLFNFDSSQGIANVRFEGLDGTEGVATLKQALALLKIKNPAVNFADAVRSGAYNDTTDEEYKRRRTETAHDIQSFVVLGNVNRLGDELTCFHHKAYLLWSGTECSGFSS